MKHEVFTLLFTCEAPGCGFQEKHTTTDKHSMPEGWGKKEIYGCGMTGYTKTIEVCPKCNVKEVKQDARDHSWRLE